MVVVPQLIQVGGAVIKRPLAGRGLVVARARTAHIRHRAVGLRQGSLDVGEGVRGRVAGHDALVREPDVRGQALVVPNRRLVELDHVLMLDVLGAVARHVESRVARAVLGELVGPELLVGPALVDPIPVHVGEEVGLAEGGDEGVDAGAGVGGNGGVVAWVVGHVGGGRGVELAGRVAVLRVAAVAEVGPEAVQRPALGRD